MSGETRTSVSGWTVDTLREFLLALITSTKEFLVALVNERNTRYEQRFAEIIEAQRVAKDAVATALLAQQQAVQRAKEDNDKRFDQFTNQRRASDDKTGTMLSRTEGEARGAALEQLFRQLEKSMGEQIHQLEKTTSEKFAMLGTQFARNDGRGAGMHAGWLYLIGGIGAVSGIAALLARFT